MASITRTTEWDIDYTGTEFRVVVLDICPNCKVDAAHGIQLRSTNEIQCRICHAPIELIPEVGSYIGFKDAHPNNLYQVLEADESGVLIDFIGNYRAVDLADVVFHGKCKNTWCIACFTYADDGNGGFTRYPR